MAKWFIFVVMEQHTDKELELLIVKQLESLIQQQEAIQLMESQQDLISNTIIQQQELNELADSVIKDLEKSNKELKANTSTSTPTTLTDSDITLISKKLLVDLTSSKNSNNKKETVKQRAERLVNQQDLKDAIKKSKSR